jgi:hypothetical protein
MKNLILTSVIVLLSVLTTSLFGQEKIEKLTIKIHNKSTYFVQDTLSDPYSTIKKEKLPVLFEEMDATLIVDLKNKKVTVSKSEKDTPYYDGVYTTTTDIISYTQKGNVITYYKKGKTWGGNISNTYVTINIKKGTYEQISYTLDNWQTVVFATSVDPIALN